MTFGELPGVTTAETFIRSRRQAGKYNCEPAPSSRQDSQAMDHERLNIEH
jgi:hypothetical protein